MSLEVTVITSLLASVLGSRSLADALIKLFKEKYDDKTTDQSVSDEATVSERRCLYLTGDKEAEMATDAAIEALDETYQTTNNIAAERMRQAKLAFNTALSLMIVGVIIIFAGVALLWLKDSFESGLITVAVGAISEILSVIVFGFNKETNNRLDELRKDLSAIDTARVGLSIAKQIEDQEKRDDAISELSLKFKNG
jgi:Cyanobacterial TRADD-N associated 2-Transmembrane domain